jgi:Flp pilus assembly protein CpaB
MSNPGFPQQSFPQGPFPGAAIPTGGPGRFATPLDAASPSDKAAKGKGKRKEKAPKGARGEKEKKASPEGRRRVSGLLAILLAVLAAVVIASSLSEAKTGDKVFVLRAKTTIQPLRAITEDQLTVAQVPQDVVEVGAIYATDEASVWAEVRGEGVNPANKVIGRYAVYPVLAGQMIRVEGGQLALYPLSLAPTERLMSLNVPVDKGVAGTLRTGDYVDIYGQGDEGAELIAANVEIVLASPAADVVASIGQENPKSDPLTRLPDYPVPVLYVVRVPAEIVAQLASYNARGAMSLVLTTAPVTAAQAATDPATDPAVTTVPAPTTTKPGQ